MTKIVKRLALLMLMLPFVACEETNYETDEFVGKKTITQLSTDNFLTFASFEELAKKVEEISNMTYEEQIKEEESKGFVSIDRIYEEITLAEEELLKPYEDLTVEELSKMPRITSAIHDMYSDILITDTLEGGGLLELPNANPNYAKVLNRKSLVKVDGKIYQFKKNETKIIEDGDESKISYLDRVNDSDSTLKIKVYKNFTEKDVVKSAYKTNGTFKVVLNNRFTQTEVSNNTYKTKFTAEVTVAVKAFGLFYLPYDADKIEHHWSFSGNIVQGYRKDYIDNIINETHSWNRNEINSEKDAFSIRYGHNASGLLYLLGEKAWEHYNDINNLPKLSGGVRNHIKVKCNNSRSIEFDMNY
ncbi:MAG: hypothetical protein II304_09525 [Bacteroidales bacterium]|nr:hypothetical protein [Bacteroidales bacterium]